VTSSFSRVLLLQLLPKADVQYRPVCAAYSARNPCCAAYRHVSSVNASWDEVQLEQRDAVDNGRHEMWFVSRRSRCND